MTPRSLLLVGKGTTIQIDENNFEYLQTMLSTICCSKTGPMDQTSFNPADAKAREEIEYSLWAFNADFVIQHCKNYDEMDNYELESAEKSLRYAQEQCCESANGLVKALIDDMDEFVERCRKNAYFS